MRILNRTILASLLLLFLILAACRSEVPPEANAASGTESATLSEAPPADTFISFAATPESIQFFWKDAAGRILGSLGALRSFAEKSGKRLRFGMNAGMYTEDQGPLGLFIAGGKTLHRLNRDTGYGNFYLRPNGVFFIAAGDKAGVCRTQDFGKQKEVRWATQSGPMLLVDGRVHPAFKPGSANLNIRNGVGILPGGKVLFALSRYPVNFYDFAQAFKQQGCSDALYLDGFVSRAYFPEGGLQDTGGAFGVMIGVAE